MYQVLKKSLHTIEHRVSFQPIAKDAFSMNTVNKNIKYKYHKIKKQINEDYLNLNVIYPKCISAIPKNPSLSVDV